MNFRSIKWKIAVAVFTAVNLAGAVYAAVMGGASHAMTHVVLLLVGLWYFGGRVYRDPAHGRRITSDASEETIGRLERSIDALALNVERIGEAQRFQAKVLEERERRQ